MHGRKGASETCKHNHLITHSDGNSTIKITVEVIEVVVAAALSTKIKALVCLLSLGARVGWRGATKHQDKDVVLDGIQVCMFGPWT